jgi:hypothetical protein
MRITLICSLIPAALLAACASGPSPLVQRLQATPEAERAYIVGTYVVTCRPMWDRCDQQFNSLSTYFRSKTDKGVEGRLSSTFGSVFSADPSFDFVDKEVGEKGFHFCMALPAGAYEFYSYDFYNYAGGGSGFSFPEKDQFSVPFSVAPGEVVALGRLKLSTAVGQNVFGMKLPAPGVLMLSPSLSAAPSVLLQKCPEAVRNRPVKPIDLYQAITVSTPMVQTLPAR